MKTRLGCTVCVLNTYCYTDSFLALGENEFHDIMPTFVLRFNIHHRMVECCLLYVLLFSFFTVDFH